MAAIEGYSLSFLLSPSGDSESHDKCTEETGWMADNDIVASCGRREYFIGVFCAMNK